MPAAEETGFDEAPAAPEPAAAEVRAWAGLHGIAVPDRGKLRREVWDARRTAHRDADGEVPSAALSGGGG